MLDFRFALLPPPIHLSVWFLRLSPRYRLSPLVQLSILTKRSEILKMDKAIAKEEKQLKGLERIIAKDNVIFEGFLRENEKKSVEARTL